MLIPEGFTTVFPYIFAQDAAAYLDFLRDGLGGEIKAVNRSPDGIVRNAHVRFDAMTFMVSEATEDMGKTYGTFYIYVEDANAAMIRAVTAGGTQRSPVADMPYGDRQRGLIDPQGNIWWISQHLPGAAY